MPIAHQPTRPPRMNRTSTKDSSTGLLMSVIRSLTASKDTTERDREKSNLEREFRDSDARLDKLVLCHHVDLTSVMQAFSKISIRLNTSKDKLQNVKEKLTTCQKLLHCKRDELKKLWLESVENKNVLDMLRRVEGLTNVPENVNNYIDKKHYLHATKLLIESVTLLETELVGVDALREIKQELIMKKDLMYEILLDELHRHIYLKSTTHLMKKFKRQGSDRRPTLVEGTPKKVLLTDMLTPAIQNTPLPRKKSLMNQDFNNEVEEDITLSNPEEDSVQFIRILLQCLNLLKRIPDAVQAIQDRMENELVNVLKRTGKELLYCDSSLFNFSLPDQFYIGSIPVYMKESSIIYSQKNKIFLLQELLDLLFQQSRSIVQVHDSVVIKNLNKIMESQDIDNAQMYQVQDVWDKLQSVLQLVTDLYLDIGGSTGSQKNSLFIQENPTVPTGNGNVSDLNVYFAKKRTGLSVGTAFSKMKKTPLFRFDLSSHAMSLNAYLQEQKEAIRKKTEGSSSDGIDSIDINHSGPEQSLVCQPAPENILIIYNPLMKFALEIEEALHMKDNIHCLLYTYLNSCARYFLDQMNIDSENTQDFDQKLLDLPKSNYI